MSRIHLLTINTQTLTVPTEAAAVTTVVVGAGMVVAIMRCAIAIVIGTIGSLASPRSTQTADTMVKTARITALGGAVGYIIDLREMTGDAS